MAIQLFPRITAVRHVENYRLALTFAGGITAELDFADRVVGRGGVFFPLEDIDFFKQVRVDTKAGALIWPNDVDLDPDGLYSAATDTPITISQKV